MASEYDFIVVGAGPSGCALSRRLADSAQKPSVLLIEAGEANDHPSLLVPGDRFTLFAAKPELNWGYKTLPQKHLKGQEIDYSRGKGLGGSTAINFSCWVIGADEDFNEWSRKVGDEDWAWKAVKERFKKVESYHVEVPEEHRKWVDVKAEDHGTNGPLHLTYADPWEKGLADVFLAAQQVGLPINPDVNSGNPIGMGMGAACMYKGERTTARSYLQGAPKNLTMLLNGMVEKVIFEGNVAKGVKTVDGREFIARKDVVLSAGALNSPQLLMLSGIGPASDLQKHNIPVLHDLPEVGKNLQDHVFSTATIIQKEGTNDRMRHETDPSAVAAARAQHEKDKTGLMNSMYCSVPMGWFKSDAVIKSKEFNELDDHTQKLIQKPTVPVFEVATHLPPLFLGGYELKPTDSYLTCSAFVMNPQSYGQVTLNSADPTDKPVIDANLCAHQYDRRVLIEAVRKLMEMLQAPVFKDTTVQMAGVPKSSSDEDIWDHCAGNLFSSWHMCSTVRMGKKEDKGACVDTDFRVRGVKNLRVADLSVIPLLPNNHTQSTAYLVGETAAEKIIKEYELDKSGESQTQSRL